jgi:hypothetical protein
LFWHCICWLTADRAHPDAASLHLPPRVVCPPIRPQALPPCWRLPGTAASLLWATTSPSTSPTPSTRSQTCVDFAAQHPRSSLCNSASGVEGVH